MKVKVLHTTLKALNRICDALLSSFLFKIKKLMAVGNPDLLRSIPRAVIEVVLAQHQAACTEGTPVEGTHIEGPTANNSLQNLSNVLPIKLNTTVFC